MAVSLRASSNDTLKFGSKYFVFKHYPGSYQLDFLFLHDIKNFCTISQLKMLSEYPDICQNVNLTFLAHP